MFPQNFFPHFLQKCYFFRKNCQMKNIQYLISHKKRYIHFRRQTPPSLQKRLQPQKRFFPLSQKIQPFLKKLLNKKIFNTIFVIKVVNFLYNRPPFLKKLLNVPPKQFFTFFSENTAFFGKNCRIKNIQHLISNKKCYIHFWCKMTALHVAQ